MRREQRSLHAVHVDREEGYTGRRTISFPGREQFDLVPSLGNGCSNGDQLYGRRSLGEYTYLVFFYVLSSLNRLVRYTAATSSGKPTSTSSSSLSFSTSVQSVRSFPPSSSSHAHIHTHSPTTKSNTAMAIVTLYQSARPGEHFFQGSTVDFGVPWAVLSVSLNVTITTFIVYQLLRVRSQLAGILPDDALQTYTGICAILVESALPFSVLGIVFAVTYGMHLPVGPAFLFVWAAFCVSTWVGTHIPNWLTASFSGTRSSIHHLPCCCRQVLDKRLDWEDEKGYDLSSFRLQDRGNRNYDKSIDQG